MTDFDIQVCKDCVQANKIVSVVDLDERWSVPWEESIAYWFVRMDFIPAHWYKILRHYVETTAE